ncbi:ATP-binding protein [Micromonospora globbae]|jgi:hypothetical protein|uniref:STAS domain-containing protein n=1 Tax=Micromonospora globbae TaxID=1894969 RepID=A0A420F166_9ACTN|nr:ATP-binding protein [Micromonospora globbae]RKF26678.1 STAS domain-containing protein [Micromonospora globbae]
MRRTERPSTRAVTGGETTAPVHVLADESSPVVRITGVLDRSGVPAVRDALLDRLVARPGPVVADLTEVRVVDPAARAVFAEVRREVAHWPSAGLLVCDPAGSDPPDPALAGVPVLPTLDAAMDAVARSPMAAVLTADLAPVPDAAREARDLLADGCRRWGVPGLVEVGSIALTEIVNNVVAHARTPMTVRLAPEDGTLRLAVRDRSTRPPSFAGPATPTSIGGRGLLLVDTLAERWGATPLPDGKVVWCVLAPPP